MSLVLFVIVWVLWGLTIRAKSRAESQLLAQPRSQPGAAPPLPAQSRWIATLRSGKRVVLEGETEGAAVKELMRQGIDPYRNITTLERES